MRTERPAKRPLSPARRSRSAGRPRFFDADELREVWLHVEECKARTGLSANKVCHGGPLAWFNVGRGGPKRVHCSGGETLRRRYQEACRLLRDEREEHEALVLALARAGAGTPAADRQPPTAAWWQDELRRRLAWNG